MMLIQFNKKQEKIASVTLSLFMSAWLLLLTQTCLAAFVDGNSEIAIDSSGSCHHTATDNVTMDDESLNSEKCLGACDCNVTATTLSVEKTSELKEKIKISYDLDMGITSKIVTSHSSPVTYRISIPPERAILLPFQSYNILLI